MRRLPFLPDGMEHRMRVLGRDAAGLLLRRGWQLVCDFGSITPTSSAARRFGAFGEGSLICFPPGPCVNEWAIRIGRDVLIAPGATISAGWVDDLGEEKSGILSIGDRCLIGRGSSLVAHVGIEIGNDVWTGHQVHITDVNHGYEDVTLPISGQHQPEAPVSIGAETWLGHGVVVLPGARVGRHVTIGAGSVVVGEIPDYSVAVGVPARVIRRYDGAVWQHTADESRLGSTR